MLKFNTQVPFKLSGFLQSLQSVLIKKNQDIRTLGTGKLLHAAGEAQGFSGWQQLCDELNAVNAINEIVRLDNSEETKKNKSALEDIMAFCENNPPDEDCHTGDIFFGSAVTSVDVSIIVSSSTALIVTVDSNMSLLSARLRTAGIGSESITALSAHQLEVIEPTIQDRVMATLSEFDFNGQ